MAPSALWASHRSPIHDCTLEAMRTQGRFSFFQGVEHFEPPVELRLSSRSMKWSAALIT